jgi:hypothetical protein
MEQVSDNVMRKLAKIKALKESAEQIGSEGEAMAAAALLNELLIRHKLEMTDIEYDLEIKEEPVDRYPVGGGVSYGSKENGWKKFYKDYPDVEVKEKRIEWSERLARMISEAYGCRFMVTTGSSRITFVGRKSNVAIVEYMYITMYRVVEKLSWKEYKTARNKVKWAATKEGLKGHQISYDSLSGYRAAWIDGFVGRVDEMLYEMHKSAEQQDSTGTALMRIDSDALATEEYLANWREEDKKNHKQAASLKESWSYNSKGRTAGRQKADEVGITASGLNNATKTAKQLK